MGKKRDQRTYKKWKSSNKKKKKGKKRDLEFKTRREKVLSEIDDRVLDILVDDSDDAKSLADFLIDQSVYDDEEDVEVSYYEEEINRLMRKQCDTPEDFLDNMKKVKKLKKKMKKNKEFKGDRTIAELYNGKKKYKKFLNKKKYKKQIKKIMKAEKRDLDDARKLGYIVSKDVDNELDRLEKANEMMSDAIQEALSSSYSQKYPF